MNSIKVSEIKAKEKLLIDAIKNNDIDILQHMMHDDLLGLSPMGSIITKEADLTAHKNGQMEVEELSAEIKEIKIFDDTAIVVAINQTKGTMLNMAIQGTFKYVRVWKKLNRDLKIIAVCCNKIA